MQTYTIIIALWKYRLNISKLRKPSNVRIFVVGPPRTLIDETSIDVYFQVESPLKDHDHLQLLQKVRELCSMYAASQRRIVVFERSLQKAVARIRKEMSVEGFYPEQLEQLLNVRDAIHNPRKNGLATLRQCSLSGSPQPEPWLDLVRSQVGGFPVVVRSIREQPPQVQEYVEDGYEFTALCTAKGGLVACSASMETHRTILECIQNQLPYAVQLFTVEQTRDYLPGVESFVTQVKSCCFHPDTGFENLLEVQAKMGKGRTRTFVYYEWLLCNDTGTETRQTLATLGWEAHIGEIKDHNDIFFLGFALEPDSETLRALLSTSKTLAPWETLLIESHYDVNDGLQVNLPNGHSPSSSIHHCVVNFPTAEGVLIHQTSIPKRPTSEIRVSWRCAEGQEMTDSCSIDENVAQVFLTNSDHSRLISEAQDIMRNTDITIDRNVLLDRHSLHWCGAESGSPAQAVITDEC
ncbi:unnamed protein product [Nippostrongylus brasiliensis]|uniref:ATP-grasp domain-containing protein n=1 Tax=Nippostrongylus brasiliensis TaxID=27835 RepID=A0A158R0L4_NIPBR|nr:unnamed protein product [Nippostrongylus brasiliensis]